MSYLYPSSLEEALGILRDGSGRARVIAGATDIFLQRLPHSLVDLTALPALSGIKEESGLITIGAAVTHSQAAASPVILAGAQALAEGCARVGSPQIRNAGTLGGNIVNAAPAADAAVALAALGARARIVDIKGLTREEAVEDLYRTHNRSLVDSSSEILVELIIKSCGINEGSAFTRFAARNALALPLVNAAAAVKVENGLVKEARLVVAPVKPAPTRLQRAEEMLIGMPVNRETRLAVEKAAASEVEVRSSLLRCSARYRLHLVGVLVGRALETAAQRAQQRKRGNDS